MKDEWWQKDRKKKDSVLLNQSSPFDDIDKAYAESTVGLPKWDIYALLSPQL